MTFLSFALVWAAFCAPAGERLDPVVEGALGVGAGAAWWALHRSHASRVETSCPCDRADINPLDRFAVDADFALGEPLADGLVGITVAGAGALAAVAAPDLEMGVGDAALVLQSAALAGLVTQIAKTGFGRPYPYLVRSGHAPARLADGVNYASFWSGHTAVPMAAAVTLAGLLDRRRPSSAWRFVAWSVGPALALAAGGLQISAGNHYPTDVIIGAAVGAAVGLGQPWLRFDW
ncbi:MAG: phosphatase PAP2 family protein [Myxococcales bacterium]|nr:phosphatase PAP2 family protein [Myxococcales bacterium]